MRKNIAKGVVFFSSIAVLLYFLIYHDATSVASAIIIALCINIISAPFYFFIIEGLSNLGKIGLFWRSYVVYRNEDVRLSISYLFRIRVNDKYLLVKNRKGNYYQLVGGTYKTLPGFEKIQQKYCIKSDRRFETSSGIAKGDLRFRLPGKFVMDIIKWFHSREDRETDQWREFCEELLTPGILDKHIFRYINHRYELTLQTPMRKAKNIDCQEILIYEIFDLLPNNEQTKSLTDLMAKGDTDEIKWADQYLIERLGFNERDKSTEYEIGAHTKWAIFEKWSEE